MPDRKSLGRRPGAAVDRRGFLKAATFAGTGALTQGVTAVAAATASASTTTGVADHTTLNESAGEPSLPRHTTQLAPREAEQGTPPPVTATQKTCGSDFMLDVMRNVGIEYVAAIPGNTFKGLHESVINYGMTSAPSLELISCMHEEMSVAIAHGYAKVAGKPMACMMHSTVGLQHAAMAFYNAYADRVPVFAIVGAILDARDRHGYVDWQHSVFDGPGLVRDFTKWDDTPLSLAHFAESATRAYQFLNDATVGTHGARRRPGTSRERHPLGHASGDPEAFAGRPTRRRGRCDSRDGPTVGRSGAAADHRRSRRAYSGRTASHDRAGGSAAGCRG
jgi:hypothetical protein